MYLRHTGYEQRALKGDETVVTQGAFAVEDSSKVAKPGAEKAAPAKAEPVKP